MSEAGERLDAAVIEGVLAAVSDPALVCDATGAVVAWNDAFAARTRTGAAIEGDPVEQFVEWTDDDAVAGALAGTETSAPGRLADGRRYDVTARPFDEGAGVVVTFDDEPAGEWSAHEAAVAAAPDNIYVVDRDYRIRLVSDAFERATKIPTEEVTGEPLSRLVDYGVIDESTLERSREALDEVFGGDREEVRFVTRPTVGGETVVAENRVAPVRRDGEIVGAVNVVRNVTERTRIEEALRTSRERLQTILDTLPVAVFVVDADGRIDHVQGFDFDAVPRSRDEVVGHPIAAFEDEYEDLVAGCRRALGGEATTATETIGDRTFETVFEPVREDGEVTGTIAVAVDVTDREERERELARTNRLLDLALDTTEAGVYEWQISDDRINWHESTVRHFDVDPSRQYSLADAVDEQVHPDDRERVRETVERAVADDGELVVEFRSDPTSDNPEWVRAEGELHRDDEGQPERIVGTVRNVTERKNRERAVAEREQRLRAVIESSADPIAMQDPDGRYRVVNEAMADLADTPREAIRGATTREVFGADAATRIERHRRDVLSTEAARVAEERLPTGDDGGDRIVQVTVAPHYDADQEVTGTVTIARDITELERQREDLATLTEIQELVQDSIGALTAANTREEVIETVCDRLAASEFYRGAWFGTHDSATRLIEPVYVTDDVEAYVDAIEVTTDTSDSGLGPGGTAYRTGEIQVVDDVREESEFAPWLDLALDHGIESLAVVPLSQGATTQGVLVVYAGEPNAFTDRVVEGFEVLGDVVGFALSAAQHRRLLESDRVLELEFSVSSDDPFVRASAEHDCRFVFDTPAQTSDGNVINYLTVEGADPSVGAETARQFEMLESLRRLDGDDGPHFELKWSDSVYEYLAEAGARGTKGVVENGTGIMYAEAPVDADVRRIQEAVAERFDSAELVAKRERDRGDTPWWRPHADLSDALTDRQREVLQAAYFSGYYQWPREVDAEELSDSLGIASTTLLQHLRKGHHRMLEAMLDS